MSVLNINFNICGVRRGYVIKVAPERGKGDLKAVRREGENRWQKCMGRETEAAS